MLSTTTNQAVTYYENPKGDSLSPGVRKFQKRQISNEHLEKKQVTAKIRYFNMLKTTPLPLKTMQ